MESIWTAMLTFILRSYIRWILTIKCNTALERGKRVYYASHLIILLHNVKIAK